MWITALRTTIETEVLRLARTHQILRERSGWYSETENGKEVRSLENLNWKRTRGLSKVPRFPSNLTCNVDDKGFVHYLLTPPSHHRQPGSPTCSPLIQMERSQTQAMKMRIDPHQNAVVRYNSLARSHSWAGAAKIARKNRHWLPGGDGQVPMARCPSLLETRRVLALTDERWIAYDKGH